MTSGTRLISLVTGLSRLVPAWVCYSRAPIHGRPNNMSNPEPGLVSADFDPSLDCFVAMDDRPAAWMAIDPAALTPINRALLVIDGTVTKFLEAYHLERVLVMPLEQRMDQATATDARWLACAKSNDVLRRRVRLMGSESERLYAWADSVILSSRLSPAMRRGLDEEPSGLGKVILDSGLETRREALWFGKEQPAATPAAIRSLHTGAFLTRSYRIFARGRPLMLITERFPIYADRHSGELRL